MNTFNFEELSYLYGLFITDGYITKQKKYTYLSIELNSKDRDLLFLIHSKCQSHINERTRNTNFKENYQLTRLTITESDLLQKIYSMGFLQTDKTNCAAPPTSKYSKKDFWRGVIDGDGSLGIRKNGPYISLTTKSELLKEAFVNLVKDLTGFQMNVTRNKRDNIYNLVVTSNNAKILAKWIYENDTNLRLERKYNKFLEINDFKLNPINGRRWTEEEVNYLKTHTRQECVQYLNRSMGSIIGKINRLKAKGDWI